MEKVHHGQNTALRVTGWAMVLSVFLYSSCGSVKYDDLILLDNVTQDVELVKNIPALVIQSDDILNIKVTSRNPETVIAFNLQTSPTQEGGKGAGALGIQEGYRVDENGNIQLPFVGQIKAAGKTIIALREEINQELIKYIPDASVQVRFMNFRVTLLGEVNLPNAYTIPNERLTILEAIGMAGDFTPYANRDEVLVIRERNGKREFARVNIQGKDLFLSTYFYLSPNDIIYVEPLKARQYATRGDFIDRYGILLLPVVSLISFLAGSLSQ